jgi:hypothetical protein
VVPAERAGSGCGDPAVHQNQLQPLGDALLCEGVPASVRWPGSRG